jgi:hypothetical protein
MKSSNTELEDQNHQVKLEQFIGAIQMFSLSAKNATRAYIQDTSFTYVKDRQKVQ